MTKESPPKKTEKTDAAYVRLHESQRLIIEEIIRRSEGRVNRTDIISAAIDWYLAELIKSGKGPEVNLDLSSVVDQLLAEEDRRKARR